MYWLIPYSDDESIENTPESEEFDWLRDNKVAPVAALSTIKNVIVATDNEYFIVQNNPIYFWTSVSCDNFLLEFVALTSLNNWF